MITITSLNYTSGASPALDCVVDTAGSTTPDYTLFWATRSSGSPLSKADIESGTGALDNGSVTASTIDALDASLTLVNALTGGEIDLFIRDSSTPAIESDVSTVTGVDYSLPSVNLAPDPGFDDASRWTSASGISVTGGKLVFDGTNPAFTNIGFSHINDSYAPISDDTATYRVSLDCTDFAVGGRIRLIGTCFDGPSISTANDIGDTVPQFIGGNLIDVLGVGTIGPFTFTVLPGTTHLRLEIMGRDTINLSLDNLVIEVV